MQRTWLILLGGIAAGCVAYAGIYLRTTSAQRSMEQSTRPELASPDIKCSISPF